MCSFVISPKFLPLFMVVIYAYQSEVILVTVLWKTWNCIRLHTCAFTCIGAIRKVIFFLWQVIMGDLCHNYKVQIPHSHPLTPAFITHYPQTSADIPSSYSSTKHFPFVQCLSPQKTSRFLYHHFHATKPKLFTY